MNFGEACQLSRSALRDTTGDSYKLDDVKNAVRLVIGELILVGRLNLASTTVTLTASSETVTLPTVTGFRPERVVRAEIGYRLIKLSTYSEVARLLAGGLSPGTVERVAIVPPLTAYMFPPPTSGDTLKLWYVPAPPALTNDSDELGIPDEYARPIIWQGVPMFLRQAGQEPNPADPAWGGFYRLIYRICGEAAIRVDTPGRDPMKFL